MKNSEIHKGLKDQEIRDYLSQLFSEERRKCSYNTDIEYIERELKKYQEMLKHARVCKGINALMDIKGWDWFDICDVISDYDSETYFNFIGTQEEYEKLMEKIQRSDVK